MFHQPSSLRNLYLNHPGIALGVVRDYPLVLRLSMPLLCVLGSIQGLGRHAKDVIMIPASPTGKFLARGDATETWTTVGWIATLQNRNGVLLKFCTQN
jgi:hypothetical protein